MLFRSDGLIIAPIFSFRKRKYHIPIIRELKQEDVYDAIFVAMRYTQLDSVVPILTENASKNIVLIFQTVPFSVVYIDFLLTRLSWGPRCAP